MMDRASREAEYVSAFGDPYVALECKRHALSVHAAPRTRRCGLCAGGRRRRGLVEIDEALFEGRRLLALIVSRAMEIVPPGHCVQAARSPLFPAHQNRGPVIDVLESARSELSEAERVVWCKAALRVLADASAGRVLH